MYVPFTYILCVYVVKHIPISYCVPNDDDVSGIVREVGTVRFVPYRGSVTYRWDLQCASVRVN